jgi:hypothetical protein
MEVGILTLVQIAKVFGKHISYFIPEMIFFTSLNNIQNKREEKAITLFRVLKSEGDFPLALRFLKILLE